MLSAIIADDEPYICQLIRLLIDWKSFGIELIGEANDGLDAFELINEKRPDIALVDIRMPSLDGLDIIRRCKENNITTRFIIVSGYAQFDYAQCALRYGVRDYLLKPVNKEDLSIALRRISNELQHFHQSQSEYEDVQSQLQSYQRSIRQRFLRDLLSNQHMILSNNTAQFNETYCFNFSSPNVLFASACITTHSAHFLQQDIIVTRLYHEINTYLSSFDTDFEIMIDKNQVVILYNMLNNTKPESNKIIATIYQLCSSIVSNYDYVHCWISYGNGDLKSLPSLSDSVLVSLYNRFFLSSHGIIDCSLQVRTIPCENLFKPSTAGNLRRTLESRNISNVSNMIRMIFHPLSQFVGYDNISGIIVPEVTEKIFDCLNSIFSETQFDCSEYLTAKVLLDNCSVADTFSDYLSRLITQIERVLTYYFQSREERDTRPIRKSKQFIEEHYAEPLTLEMVAKEVFLSPSYYSTIFKKQTNVTFSEYLTSLRLNKAKELLVQTDYSISKIAAMVGYPDSRYFSRQFTKAFGIKPIQYRKLG